MKFPKTLCVKIEKPENDAPYFMADTDITGFVEMGDKIAVGVYRLVETKTVEGIAEVSNKRSVK